MASVMVKATAWAACSVEDKLTALTAVVIEPTGWLAEPVAVEVDEVAWMLWDDPLLTQAHADAVAAVTSADDVIFTGAAE